MEELKIRNLGRAAGIIKIKYLIRELERVGSIIT